MDEGVVNTYEASYNSPAIIREIKLSKGKYCTVSRTDLNYLWYTCHCGGGSYPVNIVDEVVQPTNPFEVNGRKREVHLLRVAGGDVDILLIEYLGIEQRLKKKWYYKDRKRRDWMR